MKLFIDTSQSERIVFSLDNKKFAKEAKEGKSQELLNLINKELGNLGRDFSDIKEVEVNLGPGSYTGLRVGISIANALGWALGIPVNGRDISKQGPIKPVYI